MTRRCAFFCAALLVWLGIAALPAWPDQTYREILCGVVLNGVAVSQGSVILKQDDTYWAALSEVRSWRLTVPISRRITHRGNVYVPLDGSLHIDHVSFDEPNQVLNIDASAAAFAPTTVDARRTRAAPPERGTGGFLNYDVHMFGAARSFASAGIFDANYAANGMVLTQSFDYQAGALQSHGIVRLSTTLRHDDLADRATWFLGDAVTGMSQLGLPVRFAGITWESNFSTDPGFITFPTPQLSLAATLPSLVDIYVNGIKEYSSQVQPGPVDIANLPVVTGQGQIQVTVKDILGNERHLTSSFYASNSLLKSGLSAFSYSAGFPREDYGLTSGTYGQFLMDGTWRHGFSESFTGEAHLETQGRLTMASLAGNWGLDDIGVLALGAAESTGQTAGGKLSFGYQQSDRGISIGAQIAEASKGFSTVGCILTCTEWTQQISGNVGLALGRRTTLGLGIVERSRPGQQTDEIASFNLSRSVASGQLSFIALDDQTAHAIDATLLYSVALGRRGSLISEATVDKSHASQSIDISERTPQPNEGFAYRLLAQSGSSAGFDANIEQWGRTGVIDTEVSNNGGGTAYSVDATGSMVNVDNGWYLAPRIDNSYALVELPGYPDVHVYVNGENEGRTDSRGRLLAASLQPYQTNYIRVESSDLPVAENIGEPQITAVPYYGSPVTAVFPVKPAGGVVLTVTGSDGLPLGTGAIVHTSDGQSSWPVGEDGELYLGGVRAGSTLSLSAQSSAGPCHFQVNIPKNTMTIPNLGSFVCIPDSRQ